MNKPTLECVPEHPWGTEDGIDQADFPVDRSETSTQVIDGKRQSAIVSPLHAAAINGKKHEVSTLLQEYKDDVNAGDQMGRTPLVYSILGDRYECAVALLKSGADLNCVDIDERTPLHWAAYQGNHKFVKILLAKGADRSRSDTEGRTPLHLSTSHQNVKVLQLLLKDMDGEDIDVADDHGMTALQWASFYGQVEHARLLIKAGATINCFDNERRTALHWASSNEEATIAKLVLANDFTILNCKDSGGRTSLHYAVGAGSTAVVRFLMAMEECSLNEQDSLRRTPLHWAAVLGNTSLVELLLERGADYSIPDSNGVRALQYAAQNDFAETTTAMLANSNVIDIPDNNGRTSLMWAAGKGALKTLTVLVAHDHEVTAKDDSQTTALHMASYGGHLPCVEFLVEHGASVNAQDSQRYTPLFHSCEMGYIDIVSSLLKHNALVDLEDLQARSCLHIASLGGRVDICRILIEAGSDPGKGDILGRPPLHGASYGGFVACMKLLIDHGADVDALDKSGVSSLHWACACGSLDAVKLLISHKAFQNYMENKDDRLTPLDYAIVREHQDVAQFMIENNALTIAGIQDLAATVVQSAWRGQVIRKRLNQVKASFPPRKVSRHHPLSVTQSSSVVNASDSDSIDSKLSSLHYAGSTLPYNSVDKYESEVSVERTATAYRKKKSKNLRTNQRQRKSESSRPTDSDAGRLRSVSANVLSDPDQSGFDPAMLGVYKDEYRHRFSPSLNDLRYIGNNDSSHAYDTRSVASATIASDAQSPWRMPSYSRQPSSATDFDVHSLKTLDLSSSVEDFADYRMTRDADARLNWNSRRRTSDSSSVSFVGGRDRSVTDFVSARYQGVDGHVNDDRRLSSQGTEVSLPPQNGWHSRVSTYSIPSPTSRSPAANSVQGKPYVFLQTTHARKGPSDATAVGWQTTAVKRSAFSSIDATPNNQQDRLRRERARLDLIRRKVSAAVVIQRAVRRFLKRRRGESSKRDAPHITSNALLSGSLEDHEDIREIAALVIQLAWRSYVKRNLLVAKKNGSCSAVPTQGKHDRLQSPIVRPVAVVKIKTPIGQRDKSPTPKYNLNALPVVSRAASPRAISPTRKSSVEGLRMMPDGYSRTRRSPYSYNLVTKEQGRQRRDGGVPHRGTKSPSSGNKGKPSNW